MALGDIHLDFTWQAWHLVTSTFVSRGSGRRGTHGIGWRAWVWFGRAWRRAILRGRRGTTLHPPSFHVAGVAPTRIYLRFPWQAWHSWHWVARLGVVWARVTPRHFAWQARHNLTSTFVSRGRRGTNSHPPWFRVAGVALMALGGALGCGLGARDAAAFCVAGVVQPHAAALCVAGVVQLYIHFRFTWQAWHKLASTFVFRGRRGTHGIGWRAWVWFGRAWRRAILRGRRGTTLHPLSFHVAGVAQTRIYLRFPWHRLASTFVFRGRRGTHGIGWRAWVCFGRAWRRAILRGRRGTTLHPPSFHVAGVAQTRIHLGFAWQAWHSWHWVARLGVVWARVTPRHFAWQAWHNLTSTFVSRGRRGTNSHLPSFSVAGVALMACVAQSHTHLRFTWQAWHNPTSTFVLRGRRGTWWHPPSFCVAGMALGDIQLFLSHTIFVTHDFVTHHLSHIIFDTPSWTHHLSHHFVTHHLWHTVTDHFSHTIFHTPLYLTPSFTTPSFTHHFVTHHLLHTVTNHLSHIISHHTIFHTPTLSHTIFHTTLSRTNFVTHHLSHTNFVSHHLSHTIFHTPSQAIFHTPSFTQHFVSHHLSHTVTGHLSHTIFHTTLCLTPSFTTPSFTQICHAPTLSLTIFHTPSFTHRHRPSFTHHPSHTTLSHTIFHTQLCHTQLSHTPSFTQLCQTHTHKTPSFFATHQLSHTILSHTILFTSRSSTTSFVFPSFPIPATTFGAYYWRKLSCGVIRSFNYVSMALPDIPINTRLQVRLQHLAASVPIENVLLSTGMDSWFGRAIKTLHHQHLIDTG